MSSPATTQPAVAPQMNDYDWGLLIGAIRSNQVVPIVGSGLMRINVGDRSITYDHFIAEELAKEHQVTDADLEPLGTTLSEATLNDVVSVCLNNKKNKTGGRLLPGYLR